KNLERIKEQVHSDEPCEQKENYIINGNDEVKNISTEDNDEDAVVEFNLRQFEKTQLSTNPHLSFVGHDTVQRTDDVQDIVEYLCYRDRLDISKNVVIFEHNQEMIKKWNDRLPNVTMKNIDNVLTLDSEI